MFTMEIAGVPVGVDNLYYGTFRRCGEFLTDRPPAFTVSVSEEEMRRSAGESSAYAEQQCVYREISLRLMAYGAFLMHAAVIEVDGQGLAFAAQSGGGKTTRVNLWQRALGERVRVVNGDKPILRFMDGGLYAFGTPWRGKENLGGNLRAPLKCVCFIERAERVPLCRLERDRILPRLFHQVLVPKDPERLDLFFPLMERLITSVPFYLLRGERDLEDPEKLWDRMRPPADGGPAASEM